MAEAAAVVAIIGTAYSAYQQSEVAKFNEAVADREAEYQKNRSTAEEQRHWQRVKKVLGQQKTQYAAAGVSLLSGSVQDVYSESLQEAELDAEIIKAGGQAAIRQAESAATNQRAAGQAAIAGGVASAGSTLLTLNK